MGLLRLLRRPPALWARSPTRGLPSPIWAQHPPPCRPSGGRPYKAVIFDMGGVLIPSPSSVATEWEASNHIPSGTIIKALVAGGEKGPWMRFMRGEMTVEGFLQAFGTQCSEMIKLPVPVGSFFSLLTSGQVAKQFSVMTEAINRIRAEGLKTAVLSNNFYLPSGESFLPLDRKQFDVVVESCLEGICKPDPRIYKICLQRLQVEPTESIFLDDLAHNLKAAAQLGIHTIKVNDAESALKELETLLGFSLRKIIPNTCSVRKTMEIPRDSLEKYLKNFLGSQAAVSGPMEVLQFSHGQSNPTYSIRLANHHLVLRKKPPGKLLPSAHAVEREFRIIKALHDAGLPVPKVLDLCEDSSIIGTPFYLMEYCPGQIYKEASLPGLDPSQRKAIYTAMNQVLCQLHRVDVKAAGLEDYGKHGDYVQRQVQTWTKQYRATETSTVPAMERLIEWLPQHLPKAQKATVVHGDFRLDNLIFHPEKAEVLAILDWELSTLGDPLSDVAYNCMAHYLPSDFPLIKGLSDLDVTQLGIPTAEEYFKMYCRQMEIPAAENWNFYMAFSFFRVAAILQGVYKRSLKGQSSSAAAEQSGKLVEFMSNLAWDFAVKEGFRIFKGLPTPKLSTRAYGVWASRRPPLLPGGTRSLATASKAPQAAAPKGVLIISPEALPEPVRELHGRLEKFIETHVYPIEQDLRNHQMSEARWTPAPQIEKLKVASSDATNIESSIREERGGYVVNGHKWWISGILDPRCQLCVFMGKTDPHAPRHQQQSVLLVPMETPGIKVIRPLSVYGLEDPPGGHGEVLFENVWVPKDHLVLGPGRGFEIAQGRLGPGRIHHCMRLIGYSERTLALMKERVKSRVAFGKPLVEQGTILADIAKSRADIDQARLLVLKAAHLMDVAGNKAAALDIAMIKMVAPTMALRVIDRAIQAFGAAGLNSDSPLAQFFSWARALRLADGPDEVHRATVARMELKR
uniref:Acyl-CoA dehydrogenase family member 10 n=1 Tax=Sarcophilus harrisii TaxID=9305 RepID=A0A7N4PJ16_SARHA